MTNFWVLYVVFDVYLFLGFAFSVYNLKAYLVYKRERAVSIRAPQLVAANHCIGICMMLITSTFVLLQLLGSPPPFTMRRATAAGGYTLFAAVFVMRAWYLNWAYAFAGHKLDAQWRQQVDFRGTMLASNSWALKYAWIFLDWRVLLLYGVGAVLFVFILGTLIIVFATNGSGQAMNLLFVVFWIPMISMLVIALRSTKLCRDIYHLRKEIQVLIVLWIFHLLVAPISALLFSSYDSTGFLLVNNVATATVFFVHYYVATHWVLCKNRHFFEERKLPKKDEEFESIRSISGLRIPEKATGAQVRNAVFKRILSDSEGFKIFAEHLVREVSVENVLFVVTYMRFKQYVHSFVCYLADTGAIGVDNEVNGTSGGLRVADGGDGDTEITPFPMLSLSEPVYEMKSLTAATIATTPPMIAMNSDKLISSDFECGDTKKGGMISLMKSLSHRELLDSPSSPLSSSTDLKKVPCISPRSPSTSGKSGKRKGKTKNPFRKLTITKKLYKSKMSAIGGDNLFTDDTDTGFHALSGLSLDTFGTLVILPKELVSFRGDESVCGNPSLDACVHKLLDIFDLYLRHDGANALNVSGGVRESALDKLHTFVLDPDYVHSDAEAQSLQVQMQRRKAAREIDAENKTLYNVFDAIKTLDFVLKQALTVLRKDSFPRFLDTPEFKRWAAANQH